VLPLLAFGMQDLDLSFHLAQTGDTCVAVFLGLGSAHTRKGETKDRQQNYPNPPGVLHRGPFRGRSLCIYLDAGNGPRVSVFPRKMHLAVNTDPKLAARG